MVDMSHPSRVRGLKLFLYPMHQLFLLKALAESLGCPEGAKPIALLCIGPVEKFYDKPMLEQAGWRQGKLLEDFLFEDGWPKSE